MLNRYCRVNKRKYGVDFKAKKRKKGKSAHKKDLPIKAGRVVLIK